MARVNGCPYNIKDWAVSIRSRGSTNESPTWIPIKGCNTIDLSLDADTEDGSSNDSAFSEPYVTKRNGSLSLEVKRIVDVATGARDPGQAELAYFATLTGCDADARIKLADPVGRVQLIDVQVTSTSESVDDTSQTCSYDMEIVGAPIDETYVQVASIALMDGESAATTLALVLGTPDTLTIAFTPTTPSNTKCKVSSADTSKVTVSISGNTITLTPVAVDAVGTVVTVTSLNGNKTDTVTVTVAAS